MEKADLALAVALGVAPPVAAMQAEVRIPAVAMEADGREARLTLEQQAHMVWEDLGVMTPAEVSASAVQEAMQLVPAPLVGVVPAAGCQQWLHLP